MRGESADGPAWHTAKTCDSGQCVQVGILDSLVLVRNSSDPDGTRLAMSRAGWQVFLAGVKDGDFDGL